MRRFAPMLSVITGSAVRHGRNTHPHRNARSGPATDGAVLWKLFLHVVRGHPHPHPRNREAHRSIPDISSGHTASNTVGLPGVLPDIAWYVGMRAWKNRPRPVAPRIHNSQLIRTSIHCQLRWTASASNSTTRYTRAIEPAYFATIGSDVRSVNPSTIAWATRTRSNGSLWW